MASVGQVWDRTTEFLGEHLSRIMGVAVIGMFVPMAAMGIVGLGWATASMGSRQVIMLGYVVLYLLVFWAYLAMTAIVLDPATRDSGWRVGARRFLPGLGVYALLVVAAIALAVPMFVLMGMAGMTPEAMRTGAAVSVSRGMAWASLAYVLFYCILFLVAGARLMPINGVLVAERRGVRAIARTWSLTRGMTWRLIGVLILYVVVSQVAGLAAQTVVGSVLRLAVGGEGAFTAAAIAAGVIVAAVQTGFSVIATVFAVKLYETLAGKPDAVAVATDAPAA